MSHSLSFKGPAIPIFGSLTIIDYTAGGEAVAASELPSTNTIDGVILGTVPAGQNSLASTLFPILSGGKILLFRFVSGSPVEIPTTVALNANIFFIAHPSA